MKRYLRRLSVSVLLAAQGTAVAQTTPADAASDTAATVAIRGDAPGMRMVAPTTLVTKTLTGARFAVPAGTADLTIWGDRIIRVRVHRAGDDTAPVVPVIIGMPPAIRWTLSEEEKRFLIVTSGMRVTVDKASGAVALVDAQDKPIVGEVEPWSRRMADTSSPIGAVEQRFGIGLEQAIYGLGQHQAGKLDYRGTTVRLQQANTDVGVPMLVSTAAYGILWNNASVTEVDVAVPQAVEQLVFRSEQGSAIDYALFAGPDVDTVIAGYRTLTGQAPLMARWTFGLWQSKERYQTQAELTGVAAEYRRRGIPLDAVVQDWQYWRPGAWGSHVFDPARFPDPKAMLDTLHRENIHAIVSIWPRFDLGTDTAGALDAVGGLYPKLYRNVFPAGVGRWYDAFSPAARRAYWEPVSERLGNLGFDGFWLDGSEVELNGRWGELRNVQTALGSGATVYNAYPLFHTTAVHDGMMRDFPSKRPFILTRSAFAGQQRNAAITWSGDVRGDWSVFRQQVPAAVNFSMSGIPYWSADIGGFFGGDPKDPAYAELFTRWLQFAVFNPMFRIHGTGPGKEVYSFPQDAQAPLIDAVRLRYRLLPWLYAQSWAVTDTGASFMYPAGAIFRDDPRARDLPDQFLFGRRLLVSPVLEAGATRRSVYLPAGTAWYDFWTGTRIMGGVRINVDAPLDHQPLHVAAGTILPLGSAVQYADQSPARPVELRVYPGHDAHFLLYDDAGDGEGWRKGEHATISLSWNDAAGTLTIGARQGRFPGMPSTRIFRAVLVSVGHGIGTRESVLPDVRYTGRPITMSLRLK